MVLVDRLVLSSSSRDLLFSSPGGVVGAWVQWLLNPGCISVRLFWFLVFFFPPVHIRFIPQELGQTEADWHYPPPQWCFSFACRLRLEQSAAHTRLYAPLRRLKLGTGTCEKSPFSHVELLPRAQGEFLRASVLLLTAAGTLAPSAL